MVIVSLDGRTEDDKGALYGYALEAPCVVTRDEHHEAMMAGVR